MRLAISQIPALSSHRGREVLIIETICWFSHNRTWMEAQRAQDGCPATADAALDWWTCQRSGSDSAWLSQTCSVNILLTLNYDADGRRGETPSSLCPYGSRPAPTWQIASLQFHQRSSPGALFPNTLMKRST